MTRHTGVTEMTQCERNMQHGPDFPNFFVIEHTTKPKKVSMKGRT